MVVYGAPYNEIAVTDLYIPTAFFQEIVHEYLNKFVLYLEWFCIQYKHVDNIIEG